MKPKHCYLCNETKFSQVDGTVRDMPKLKILKCDWCDLIFLESFNHINKTYYQDSNMIADVKYGEYRKRCKEEAYFRAEKFKCFYKNKRLLDFGCGTGDFLWITKSLTKRCAGIEQNKHFAELIKTDYHVKIYSDASQVKEKFDIITLFHVLEHLKNPIMWLQKLSQLLAKNGYLFIEIPNANDALLEIYNSEAFKKFYYWKAHLYYFTEWTFRKLIEKANLRILGLTYIQRYNLANHLHWLATEKPNGHNVWKFLSDDVTDKLYAKKLRFRRANDTIIALVKCK